MIADIQRVASTTLPTRYGTFSMSVYEGQDGKEHVALTIGALDDGQAVKVRLHSECMTGDTFGSQRCDCGEQLDRALRYLQDEGRGALLYLRQEGRGIGLANKIRAYALQDQGYDTVDANRALGLPDDARDYRIAADILRDLGVAQVELITNNPAKIDGLRFYGINVSKRIPVYVEPNQNNSSYLRTKHERMGHIQPRTIISHQD